MWWSYFRRIGVPSGASIVISPVTIARNACASLISAGCQV
jgi:hypothetical protein